VTSTGSDNATGLGESCDAQEGSAVGQQEELFQISGSRLSSGGKDGERTGQVSRSSGWGIMDSSQLASMIPGRGVSGNKISQVGLWRESPR